jgi:cytochrome P450
MPDANLVAPFEYDLFSDGIQEDPYPAYEWLHSQGPVYHNERRDFYALARFEDVATALRDWKHFSSSAGVRPDDLLELQGPSIIAMVPPRHRELRQLVQPAFLPQAIARLESFVERQASALLDASQDDGAFDVVERFGRRLPVSVICELMGLPPEDGEVLKNWADEIVETSAVDGTTSDSARLAGERLRVYFTAQLEDRRGRQGDDLVSRLLEAAVPDDPRAQAEAVGMCNLLFEAGNSTTSSLISNSLCALAANPEQRAWIIANPESWAGAIEELLRYDSPVQNMTRTLTEPLELHGVPIPAGATVVLVIGAANRDPRVWDAPNELRLDREPQRNLAFGAGLHHCVGAPLARLEGRVALRLLLSRMPDYEIVTSERVHDINLHMHRRLVVRPTRS